MKFAREKKREKRIKDKIKVEYINYLYIYICIEINDLKSLLKCKDVSILFSE